MNYRVLFGLMLNMVAAPCFAEGPSGGVIDPGFRG